MKKTISILLALVLVLSCVYGSGISTAYAATAHTFTEVDGSKVKTGEKDVTVLVFGRPTCYNTNSTLNALAAAKWINNDKIKVAFVDIDMCDKATIADFKDEIDCDYISFCYDTTEKSRNVMWNYVSGYITLPCVLYFDKNSECQIQTTGLQSANAVYNNICKIDSSIFEGGDVDFSDISIVTNVKYCQTEARKIIDNINEFRTGSDAWYWNSSSTQKVYPSGLKTLTYDYNLELAAMQRAAEVAVYFDHKRPNGKSCFTLTEEYGGSGENLTAGVNCNKTAEEAHISLREDDYNYSGQGHRRNMLDPDWKAFAAACVYCNGAYYWVEEFSTENRKPSATAANNSNTDVTIEISVDSISSLSISGSTESISLKVDEVVDLPKINASFELTECWPSKTTSGQLIPKWQVENKEIATAENNSLTGVKGGSTNVFCTAYDQKISIPVNVSGITFELEQAKFQYTGQPITPTVKNVKIGKTTLSIADYKISYADNTDIGTATVTVTGLGSYSEYSASMTFEIYCAHPNTILIEGTEPTCTESGKTSGAKCSLCGRTTKKQETIAPLGHSYEEQLVAPATLTDDGELAYICIRCGDKISGTIVHPGEYQLSRTSYKYAAKAYKPEVTVYDVYGNVIEKTDYTVTYLNNQNVGTGTAKVTFRGNYSGTKNLSFRINPVGTTVSKLTAKKKALTVSWKKQATQTMGYQIQYAKKASFSGAKTVTIKNNSSTKKTIKKLTSKKKYYVRIRTYKTVNGKKYYSSWSKAKSVKVK